MKYFFKLVRLILTPFVILFDKLTEPKWPQRSQEDQAKLDKETANLSLYHFRTCPFCVKTRHDLHRLGLNVELRDAQNDAQHEQALIEGGGKRQVPCLRIQHDDGKVEWLYESNDIRAYLEQHYGKAA